VESKIVTPHSAKLFCLLPAFPNSSGAGQRCSGIESSGEARTRAHRGDSSGRRTSPPIPAPGSVVIVRRCSTIMASDILPWSCESKQTVREPRPDFIPATNSFLHSPLCEPELVAPLLQSFKVRSATPANGEPLQTRFSVMTGHYKAHLPVGLSPLFRLGPDVGSFQPSRPHIAKNTRSPERWMKRKVCLFLAETAFRPRDDETKPNTKGSHTW